MWARGGRLARGRAGVGQAGAGAGGRRAGGARPPAHHDQGRGRAWSPDVPRYTGVRTFASLPQAAGPDGLRAAVLGIPFDTATSYRAGARFGPEAIRSASALLRPYEPALEVDALDGAADCGDVAVTPGNAERTVGQIAASLEPFASGGMPTLA